MNTYKTPYKANHAELSRQHNLSQKNQTQNKSTEINNSIFAELNNKDRNRNSI